VPSRCSSLGAFLSFDVVDLFVAFLSAIHGLRAAMLLLIDWGLLLFSRRVRAAMVVVELPLGLEVSETGYYEYQYLLT